MTTNIKQAWLTILLILTALITSTASANTASEKLPVFVSPDWVMKNLDQVKLIDMSEQLSYRKFHLPNATWVDYKWLIKPQDGLQLSGGREFMSTILSKLGISETDTVIIYDDIGGLEASRLYWELSMLNHKRMAIMDGGSTAWVLRGYPVTQAITAPAPSLYKASEISSTHFYYADQSDVLSGIKNPKIHLIDTRTQEEFVGSPAEKRSGHIPTAVLFPWDAVLDPLNGFRQRTDFELAQFFKQLNIANKNDHYILYCNTAHRAARLWTAMKSQGYNNLKMYDASMQEWAVNPELPMIQGPK